MGSVPEYRVGVEAEFAYAHRLGDHPGKCGRLHGHNGVVRAVIAAAGTDRRGMVADFGDVKAVLKRWIEARFDHRVLLHRDDPLVPVLRAAGQEVAALDGPPTAETIARLIHDGLRAEGIPVAEVEFRETPTSCAAYRDAGGFR